MAPVLAAFRPGEVALHVREQRAGNMGFAVLLRAELGLHEIVATVEDAPVREVVGELLRRDQRGVHDAIMAVTRARIATTETLIRPHIRRTPVLVEGNLVFKLELLQHSGSFKARGAFTNLLTREV